MRDHVTEDARDIPVLLDADVLVVGGGVAGCAAAWGAGRAGARTVLLERNGCLGGVATASLMANIGNRLLNATGVQLIRGFAGAVIDRLVAVGAASPHWCSRDVPGCVIDSERLKLVLIEMLEEQGVTILTHALGARPILAGARVTGCFVESKSGRQAITARVTVDCTGEADLAWQAGAVVEESPGTASTLFKMANVDVDAFVAFLNEDPDGFPAGMDWVKDLETFNRNWQERGILFFPHGGGRNWRQLQNAMASGELTRDFECAHNLDHMGLYGLRGTGFVAVNSNFYRIEDLDIRNLARFEVHAQRMCYRVAAFLQRHVPGFSAAAVAHVGVDLGIRNYRQILSEEVLSSAAVANATAPSYRRDVIGTTPVVDSSRECGEYFKPFAADVPFGITVPQGCENLLVGSAKSVGTRPRALIRGMSGCMICGQGAGVAAAVAVARGTAPANVPLRDLQRELLAQDVYLGNRERLVELGLL